MEIVIALIALAIFVSPLVISIISMVKAADASQHANDANHRLDALSIRIDNLEQRLASADVAAAPVEEEAQEPSAVTQPEMPAAAEIEEAAPLAPELAPEPEEPPVLAIEEPAAEAWQGKAETIEPETVREEAVPEVQKPVIATIETTPQIRQHARHGDGLRTGMLEEKLVTNWLVWLGGIAVAMAGVFLVRYAAERGWLSPELRCIAGVLLGATLVVAGEAIRRRPLERAIAAIKPDYVPQALTAAGLFTAFASVYLAHAFYDLLPATLTFLLLGAIALAGFGLSLLQGQFVAALGLLGAMGTPALVSTDNPTPGGFFSYLAIIVLAAMAVSDRRRWWWLSIAAVGASFIWTLVWLKQLFALADITPIASFVFAIAGAALVLASRSRHRGDGQIEVDRFGANADGIAWLSLAASLMTIFLISLRTEFAPAAHWAFLAAAAGAAATSRWQPRFDLVLAAVSALAIIAFGLTYVDLIALDNLGERAFGWPEATLYSSDRYGSFLLHAPLISVVTFLGGFLALATTSQQRNMAVATALVPVVLLMAGYAEFRNISGDAFWAIPAAALMGISAIFAGALLRRGAVPADVTAVYVTTAIAAALLALTFLFDRLWLTIAYAAMLVVLGAISLRIDLAILRKLSSLIAMLVVLRLTVNPDLRGYELFHPLGMQWVTYGYLVPAAAFFAGARLFRRTHDDLIVTVLEGGALLFAIMFVSIEIRIFMTGTIYSGAYELAEMSLQTIAWLSAALILCMRHEKHPRLFSLFGAWLLAIAGTAQAVLLQLVVFNPVFTGEAIQGRGLFNLLILALLAPAVLTWLIADKLPSGAKPEGSENSEVVVGLRAVSTLLAFAFVTEEVRVFFQGMVITPQQASLLELYVTTLVWLVPGLLPFVLRRGGNTGLRMAALGFLAASALMIVFGHLVVFNPAVTGDAVRGWPVFNTLLLGFFVPAAVFFWLSRQLEGTLRPLSFDVAYLVVFVGMWLMVKQGFNGAHLVVMHQSLLELYLTTLIWLAMAALPLVSSQIGAIEGATQAGYAVLLVSLGTLFWGHVFRFNPVFDGSMVRGYPVLNTLLLGFVLPAAILGVIVRFIAPAFRPWLAGAAYLLLFIGVTLIVKQAFQGQYLVLDVLSERENYAYSASWIALAVVTMLAGIYWAGDELRYAALAVLIIAVLKVFLLDMSGLGGLWRVASFLGLGVSLIGIGWVHQRFIYGQRRRSSPQADAVAQG